MMTWVDANTDKIMAEHNFEFHWAKNEQKKALRDRFIEREREAREDLQRMM